MELKIMRWRRNLQWCCEVAQDSSDLSAQIYQLRYSQNESTDSFSISGRSSVVTQRSTQHFNKEKPLGVHGMVQDHLAVPQICTQINCAQVDFC